MSTVSWHKDTVLNQHQSNKSVPLIQSWIICLTAALFFMYEAIQMNMFNSLSSPLIFSFHLNATQLGQLSASYFWANLIFLIPAGYLLDRFSTRIIILISLGLCIVGTVLFAHSHYYITAYISRFLTGVGAAFCLLSCMRLASRWFPANMLAFVAGIIVSLFMVGGTIAQTPFTLLIQHVGWRMTLLIDALGGVLIFIVIYFIVKDYPEHYEDQHQINTEKLYAMGYIQSYKQAFLRRQNWLGGLYTSLTNLPIMLLGGLWGLMYIEASHGYSKLDASLITSMLFIGTIIGSPLAGWISDMWGKRRPPMLIGSILSACLLIFLIQMPIHSRAMVTGIFLILGIISSTQVISYPMVTESSPPAISSMSLSLISISVMISLIIAQPLFGYFMDLHAKHSHTVIHHIYSYADFRWAMWILPISCILASLAVFGIKETYCHPQERNKP